MPVVPNYNFSQPVWPAQNPYFNQSFQQNQPDHLLMVPINNPQQVDIYPVAAGSTVMLIDWNHKKLYSKTNPGNGSSPVLKVYGFEEENISKQSIDTNSNLQNSGFATLEDVKALSSQIEDIKKMLDDLTK